jgi:hypothetical protein
VIVHIDAEMILHTSLKVYNSGAIMESGSLLLITVKDGKAGKVENWG